MNAKVSRAKRKLEFVSSFLESPVKPERYHHARRSTLSRPDFHEDLHILTAEMEELFEFCEDNEIFETGEDGIGNFTVKKKEKEAVSIVQIKNNHGENHGKHVSLKGEIRFTGTGRGGEHWHVFSDHSGILPAMSREQKLDGKGVVDGIFDKTKTSGQHFLEIRSFRKC